MKTLTTLLGISMMAAVGCTTDDPSSQEISTTMLAGTVGGQPWTFQAGETNAFLSEGEPDFFAELYGSAVTACGTSTATGDHLIASVPKTPGDYPLSLSRNMTFVVGDNNLIGLEGRIVIDEVTATAVKGGMVVSYDDANSVNGRFELTICP